VAIEDDIRAAVGDGPRDPAVDRAKRAVMAQVFPTPRVIYHRQAQVALERDFFHWVTGRALRELVAERVLIEEVRPFRGSTINLYWPRRHRYPRREAANIVSLVDRFSDPGFARGLVITAKRWRTSDLVGLECST